MRINHNISAMNAHRQMTKNSTATASSLEKLSSGLAINKAGDNAAGLAISEKMRSQIRGLSQAEDNSNDAISLIQTAEGGLQETHSILQRMRELSVQSANGTYDDSTDRANLNKEFEALKSEVDRIASSTNFNGINLLNGSIGGGTGTIDTADAKTISSLTSAGGQLGGGTISITAGKVTIDAATGKISGTGTGGAIAGADVKLQLDATSTGFGTAAVIKGSFKETSSANGVTTFEYQAADNSTQEEIDALSGMSITISANANRTTDAVSGITTVTYGSAAGALTTTKDMSLTSKSGIKFQIGANGSSDQVVSLGVGNMNAKSLGISDLSAATQDDANSAIDALDTAINTVSGTRADLGAMQNRLESTINSLGVANENLTAAESQIRDVDMASEMMNFTKNNILNQAAQAMLAQANTLPQGVLQLLQ